MELIYDLIGVGVGPFNLGLAALCDEISDLRCIFFEKNSHFAWHSGMLLDNAKLQVPFHADLVTLANPKSPFSYLCYLKDKNRLFRFSIKEDYFPLRQEYNDYCIWVCNQLNSLRFSSEVKSIDFNYANGLFNVLVINNDFGEEVFVARNIVVGIGSNPAVPGNIKVDDPLILHSSNYMHLKSKLMNLNSISVIGSGQSAAEIFNDLLSSANSKSLNLSWITKSSRFFPMDYSSFALEMTSPDYIDYFFDLDEGMKGTLLKEHAHLYKGINKALIDHIYDLLYIASIQDDQGTVKTIKACSELVSVEKSGGQFNCRFRQLQKDTYFSHKTDALILATGYKYLIPEFINPIRNLINWDSHGCYRVNRNYSIDRHNSIFVQNAEIHSHGFNAPDLGMGPYRNSLIINAILKREYFTVESNIAFQDFA